MVDVRSSQDHTRIVARVKPRAPGFEFQDASVLAMGPLGVELVLPPAESRFDLGDAVDLEISAEGEQTDFGGLVIAAGETQDGDEQITIRFLSNETGAPDRREGTRWICPSTFLPVAVGPAPGQFNEFVSFQIRNISRSGLELNTELENRFLLKGMLLRLSISLPLIGDTAVIAKIVRVNVKASAGKEILSLGAEFVDADFQARELLTQYLLQFSDIDSFEDMRAATYSKSRFFTGISYCFVQTEADYRSYLGLQSDETGRAYSTCSAGGTQENLYGRIAIAKRGDKVVGSVRVTFPGHAIQARPWPESLPRRDQVVELSDLRIPSEQASVFRGLLSFVCSTSISGQRPYILCHQAHDLGKLLIRMGMKEVASDQNEKSMFIGHPIQSVTGTGASPILWNIVWGTAARYLIESKTYQPTGVTRVMLRVYRSFGSISSAYLKLLKWAKK